MANRHAHKKLRAEIRARMAKTGESYQAARDRILSHTKQREVAVDLLPLTYFGVPLTLATGDAQGHFHTIAVIRHTTRLARSFAVPLVAWAWLRPNGVN
jgi:hypothetical protein